MNMRAQQIHLEDAVKAQYDAQEADLVRAQGPAPSGVSPVSTLNSAASGEPKPEVPQIAPSLRPTLPPPDDEHYMLGCLKTFACVQGGLTKALVVARQELEVARERSEQIMRERTEAIAKEVEIAKSQKTWTTFSNVLQYIGYGLSLALVEGGSLGAIALRVFATAGLLHRIGEDTGATQKLLAYAIESGRTREEVSAALGIAASVGSASMAVVAWQTNALKAVTLSQVEQWFQMASTVSALGSKALQAKVAVDDRRRTTLQAALRQLDGQRELLRVAMADSLKGPQQTTKILTDLTRSMSAAVKHTQVQL